MTLLVGLGLMKRKKRKMKMIKMISQIELWLIKLKDGALFTKKSIRFNTSEIPLVFNVFDIVQHVKLLQQYEYKIIYKRILYTCFILVYLYISTKHFHVSSYAKCYESFLK